MFLRLTKAAAAVGIIFAAQGCSQEMANQPRVDVMEPSAVDFMTPEFRTPVPGTVSRGQDWEVTPMNSGSENDQLVAKIPVEVTAELLERGQSRYNIFCQTCHGISGSGDGMVVQRGFPAPPSYHIDRLRNVADGHLFVTMRDGLGRMPRFGNRITPEDRWAITAYIRALQLSQNAQAGELDSTELQNIK